MRKYLALPLLLLPNMVQTHPHVFIDTGLKAIVDDQNRLTQITVTWVYDDLYSLLIAEDYRIDSDGDGALNDQETRLLSGFDANWVEGYNGDLVAKLDGKELVLSGPKNAYATMRDGRIISMHTRDVQGTPELTGELTLKPFDITYYTAYAVTLSLDVEGREGCEILKKEPDISAEMLALQQELQSVPADADPVDVGLNDVGASFATTVSITCAAL